MLTFFGETRSEAMRKQHIRISEINVLRRTSRRMRGRNENIWQTCRVNTVGDQSGRMKARMELTH